VQIRSLRSVEECSSVAKKHISTGDRYELLLATARDRTCYNPTCSEPLLAKRAGLTIPNFVVAHIRDEQPPSNPASDVGWRFWPDDLMIDQRNHFSNLMLLCDACHKLVDKVDPRSYSPELLQGWKVEAEGPDAAALASTVGTMTTDALEDLFLRALRDMRPTREVQASLVAGVIDGAQAVTVPVGASMQLISSNPVLCELEPVVVIEAVNHGALSATVVSFALELRREGRQTHPTLISPDPHGVNVTLPVEVLPGARCVWVVHTEQLTATIRAYPEAMFTEVVGVVRLATGEHCLSDPAAVEDLPMWSDPGRAADLARMLRSHDRREGSSR
jgi:hypothetical protein